MSRRRARVLATALVLVLGLALTGCATVEQARGSADRIGEQAGQLATEARRLGELSASELQDVDVDGLREQGEVWLGDNASVTALLRSMPSGPDMESFRIVGEEGRLVVTYGDHAAEVDPAVLDAAMRQVADRAKDHVRNLETVEFRVGERSYTF
ncbi:MAG TPA: hypothetical protein VIG75_04290 [Citricoccus sp.]